MEGDDEAAKKWEDEAEISIHSLRVEGDVYAPGYFLAKDDISIHSLRVEGDICKHLKGCEQILFQSTPSVWRETLSGVETATLTGISIHSLRVEGDLRWLRHGRCYDGFQSTPSVWRETKYGHHFESGLANFNPLPPCGGRLFFFGMGSHLIGISIHSLRVEGDRLVYLAQTDPGEFQSTPSVWRETSFSSTGLSLTLFQSTPSVWRETGSLLVGTATTFTISIHSLRVEGDHSITSTIWIKRKFQSTPSVWRETGISVRGIRGRIISIHSLRVEGD